ncbi:NrtA/SsuA/CpmA family ABC transporter substrate-binding protein [Verrucosispora sp. WMMC514]|uniref:ABC transporter substrate-binding protein n=1 Tax=Verrucosispora sp. WMMC514 TaxID=3015156 RepID=UPI00248B4888|nr:NrtA/SsuA/CpmA family ABC transporter substrate-binding protein [Verrucosispora sp. WMMC514]WBB91265.1 NrtA/SsuA/CpmA family ABC transporter substrate-binding protein [Verrucosispora sp. WMMC514]
MKRRTTTPRVLTAALAGVLVLAGCGGVAGDTGGAADPADRVAYDGPRHEVRVGVLRQPHLSHALFYERYLPEGVTLEVVPFANSTEIKNAVVSGDLEFGVTGITSALQGAASGERVVVVAAAADGGSAIVAGKDAGITGVADLRGKRIGYVPGSAQDILLRLTLRDAGLAVADVSLVNVQFADMAAALSRGDIDAFSGAEVGPSDALAKGDAVLVTHPYDTDMGKINIAFVTNAEVIEKSPALVTAMVAVHAKATEHMAAAKSDWIRAVVDQYGFREESLSIAVENITLRWLMDDSYLAQIKVLGEQMRSVGSLQQEPDYTTFVDTSFVGKARP